MLCLAQAFVKSTQNNMNLDAASGRPSAVVCAVGHTGSIRRPSPAGDRRLTLDHIIPSARPTKLPPSSMNTACNHSKSHTKCVSAYSSCCCPEDRRLTRRHRAHRAQRLARDHRVDSLVGRSARRNGSGQRHHLQSGNDAQRWPHVVRAPASGAIGLLPQP